MKRITPVFATLSHEQLSSAARAAQPALAWLWHGYLAPANITLLTGQWKCGKTTLVAALLGRLGAGGTLAGLPVKPGKAVVVTEESPAHWHERTEKFGLGPHLSWLCQPFSSKPSSDEWLALIDHLANLRQTHGLDLAVIDPLASFLPGHSESNAVLMLDALLPLQRLTSQGVAVLLVHHPRKKEAAPGGLARGSGALSSHVDILIEMAWHADPTGPDRRRRLRAFSRHAATPRQQVIELSADGADYQSLGTLADLEFAERWQQLRTIFAEADRKLTRRAVRRRWNFADEPPSPPTLWRWLTRAAADGLLRRDGTGRKNDPYRFCLPERHEELREDMEGFFNRLMKESVEQRRGETGPDQAR